MPDKELPKPELDILSIFPQIDDIGDDALRKSVVDVWETLWQQSDWTDINAMPTSVEIPYPHVPHNQCVLSLALSIADCYEKHHGVKVNRDYLIAAAALQDAAKLVENRPAADGKMEKTAIGAAFPHAFWGAHVAVEKGVPDAVVHIMLYHSPKAAKFPDSLEGKILYYADQLDVMAIYKHRFHKEMFITKEVEKRY